ncbi:MAG: LysE family translocator [Proteobacteria bacterium]|nr:LysE family translocator [Pseudomonadota bacterium]
MPAFDTTLSFFVAAVLLALAPGPDNLTVLAQSLAHGRRAAFAFALGCVAGVLGHTAAVAAGLAAVIATSATAFGVLKALGAAYLLYLAWQAWRAPADTGALGGTPAAPPAVLFRRGVLMNLTNPKVLLFFLALLPQFTDPARGPVATQVLWLGLVFMVAALLVFGAIAWFGARLGGVLRGSARAQRLLNRATAVLFAALALRLVTASR